MNTLVSFELCTLTDKELLKKVDEQTDNIYKTGKIPSRNIPARPDEDYDLLVGELIKRFSSQLQPQVMPTEGLAGRHCNWKWTYKNPNRIIADCKAPMGQFYLDYGYKYCPNCGRKVIVEKSKPA